MLRGGGGGNDSFETAPKDKCLITSGHGNPGFPLATFRV